MPRKSVEDLGPLGDLPDLSLLERERPLGEIVKGEDSPLPQPRRKSPAGWLVNRSIWLIGILATLASGMFLNGFRIWHIDQETPEHQLPYQASGGGDAYLCYLWGSAAHVLVDGRSGTLDGPPVEKLPRKLLFPFGGCKEFVPLEGNSHIKLYFEEASASGWGLYKKN